MSVLQVSNFTKNFGEKYLFKNINFAINEHERVALVGANGTGKSTIIKMIIGEEEISPNLANEPAGTVSLGKNVCIGYLSQDVISSVNNTLLEEALDVFKEQIRLEEQLLEVSNELANNPDSIEAHNLYAKTLEKFELGGGYDYHYLIEMILLKFGFAKEDFNRPINSFSGGERTKMAFAKLLLLKPDLLILDEPTNHLDISTIDWLENYLKSYSGAILFVSHDRYFVNALANRILELENCALTNYKGDYDNYLKEKQMRYELQLKEYNLQQKEIEKLQRFITYFKPKPRFVARAKDREKKLEHMKKIDKPISSKKGIKFSFQGEMIEGKKTIAFEDCSLGYEGNALIEPFSFTFMSDDRLAIMGDNGVGKTTLLRSILGEVNLVAGNIQRLRPISLGYLKQNDFDLFDCNETVVEHITNNFPNMSEQEARQHLGKFAFQDDDVFKEVSVLSGGEKMRLVLAKLVLKNYDVLLLDEPTNHLDLITREALIDALSNYQSGIIMVSHDRYFVDALANKILFFHDKKSYYHEGNYETFKQLETGLFEYEKTPETKNKKKEVKKNNNSVNLKRIENEIIKIEERLKEISKLEFEEEYYMDEKKMKLLEDEKKELEEKYEELSLVYLQNSDN